MPTADRIRLSLMMFLNYVIWGSWYVTLGAYLTINLKFTGTQTGAVFCEQYLITADGSRRFSRYPIGLRRITR